MWCFPTRNTRVRRCLLGLENPRPALRAERSSSVTASRVAQAFRKGQETPCWQPVGPFVSLKQQPPREESSAGFSQRAQRFSLAADSGFLPVPMTSQGKHPWAPPQCQQSGFHSSGFLLIWGESLFLVFWRPPSLFPSVAQSTALLCVWRRKAVPSNGTF